MPVSLSLVERVLLRAGVIPAPLVDFAQHAAYRLFLVAQRLGVFEGLADGPLALAELAGRLEAQQVPLAELLDLLRRLGYLSFRGGRYANTVATTRYLTTRSPQSLLGAITMFDGIMERWEHLDQAIRDGEPPYTAYEYFDQHPECWPPFHAGQRALAQFTADEMATKARLPDRPLRLIDLGGSHALYTIALCRRYPELRAVVYDWPDGVAAARRGIVSAGMEDRITTRTGDFFRDDLGQGYDVALLGNIIHGQPPKAIRSLFSRVHEALDPDGMLLILDQVRIAQPFTRFAGYMAVMTGLTLFNELGGALYPYTEIRDLLHLTGYGHVRLRRLLHAPGSVLIQSDTRENHMS